MAYKITAYLLLLTFSSCLAEFKWDYFVYAQTWPMAACALAEEEHHQCSIPPDVKFWTIHGLWPSEYGKKDSPVNCNGTWHFNPSQIQSIENEMDTYWPNLYTDTPKDSFWQHEWQKHGTCCSDLSSTRGELNYFTQGLKLYQRFDMTRILADSGIVPDSNTTYSLQQFYSALKKSLGFYPHVFCTMMKDKKTGEGKHIIYSIELCLDKFFNTISCTSNSHDSRLYPSGDNTLYFQSSSMIKDTPPQSDCPTHENFYYPPIDYSQN